MAEEVQPEVGPTSGQMDASWLGRSWELLSASIPPPDASPAQSHDTLESVPEAPKLWETVAEFEADRMAVSMYISSRTGLRVCVARVDGPLVHGYFSLATEAVTSEYADADDGLPHTLEHLVFLGSEEYPYKGVLDQLANRALAQGTNAWTDRDCTCYTLSTAGPEGFLGVLPVFMDHILYPTLTDSAFLTEVHHVDEDGSDAGVVYNEQQARENTDEELLDTKMRKLLYPVGCGYRSNTGGKMENLRSLGPQAVRRYHADYYRPSNLCVIVVGQVDPEQVFVRLEPIEQKVLSKGPLPSRPRPWWHPPGAGAQPPRAAAEADPDTGMAPPAVVSFPSESEDTGLVSIGWPGPPWEDFQAHATLNVMWLYLADSAVSPLRKAIVERDDAPCGRVSFDITPGLPGTHQVVFHDCDAARLQELPALFTQTVRQVVEEGGEGIDLERIAAIVHRERVRHRSCVEEDPPFAVASALQGHFLYGDRGPGQAAQLQDRLQNVVSRLEALPTSDGEAEPGEGMANKFWRDFIGDTLLNPGNPGACVIAQPSAAMADSMAQQEQARVSRQRAELGEAGLAAAGEALYAAVAENERECPPHLLEELPIPDVARVPKVPVVTVRAECPPGAPLKLSVMSVGGAGGTEDLCAEVDLLTEGARARLAGVPEESPAHKVYTHMVSKGLLRPRRGSWTEDATRPAGAQVCTVPFTMQWDHISTAFVEVTAWLDTSGVPDNLRPYLQLMLDVIPDLPVRLEDGRLLRFEDVTKQLQADTVYYSSSLGHSNFQCSTFSQFASVALKLEAVKYRLAVQWLRRLLYQTEFTKARVRVAASRLLADVGNSKRSGVSICQALMWAVNFDAQRSNHAAASFMRQQHFLQQVLHRLKVRPADVLSDLEELRRHITLPHCLRVHVTCDLLEQADPVAPWVRSFLPPQHQHSRQGPAERGAPAVQLARELRTPEGRDPAGKGLLITTPNIESGYLMQCSPCELSFASPELPAVLVAIEYLVMVEGDLWRRVRGMGLAYGFGISVSPEQGLLTFSLYRTGDPAQAYLESQTIVQEYVSGQERFDPVALEAAKCSVMFEYIEQSSTAPAAAAGSFLHYFRGVGPGYEHWLVKAIADVTEADMLAVFQEHFSRLFDVKRSSMVVVAASAKERKVKAGLAKLERPMLESGSLDACFLRINPPTDEDSSETCSTIESEAEGHLGTPWYDKFSTQGRGWAVVGAAAMAVAAIAMARKK